MSAHLCVQERANGLEPPPQDEVQDLRSQVDAVKDLMTQNVDRILARDERLNNLVGKSEDLQAGVSITTLLVNKVLRYCCRVQGLKSQVVASTEDIKNLVIRQGNLEGLEETVSTFFVTKVWRNDMFQYSFNLLSC